MISNALVNTILTLIKICSKCNIRIVLMGGIAASFYARPRATYDVDGIIDIEHSKIDDFLKIAEVHGFRHDKAVPVKFIQRLPFVTLFNKKDKLYVDLFIAENEYQKSIVKRSKKIKLGSKSINIIAPEDLILLKLQTGREKDTEDVRNILSENYKTIDMRYLKKWAGCLSVKVFLEDELKSLRIK